MRALAIASWHGLVERPWPGPWKLDPSPGSPVAVGCNVAKMNSNIYLFCIRIYSIQIQNLVSTSENCRKLNEFDKIINSIP
jgi:hypothetical protein